MIESSDMAGRGCVDEVRERILRRKTAEGKMLEPVIFESVVKVVDRLTDLLKYRQGRRKEFFSSVIEPLFNDLLTMHANYIKMFDECQAQLEDETVPLSDIIESLRQKRTIYEAVRIKSRAIIVALRETELEAETKRFLQVAAFHIPDGILTTGSSAARARRAIGSFGTTNSVSRMLLHRMQGVDGLLKNLPTEMVAPHEQDRTELSWSVTQTLNEVRHRWSDICEEYIRLKVWALR